MSAKAAVCSAADSILARLPPEYLGDTSKSSRLIRENSPAARQVVKAASQVCGVELKVKHLEPTWVPPVPQEVAAVQPDGFAEEQVSGGHFQKARKPQLT